jgi:L-ascorbate metabolism protein UlaG (beta-lactamase superfamily)
MANVTFTWLGHGTYRFDSVEGKRIYVDPWLGNPKCPDNEKQPERMDVVAITHGHNDHTGDVIELAKAHAPAVIAMVELGDWLEGKQGLSNVTAMNKGGTVEVAGVKFSMTRAEHSSGFTLQDGSALFFGEPAGYVIEFENGLKVYCAGDTDVFSDMQLIARQYSPDVAVLPIGDFYTMGPRGAALALELLGSPRCIPVHWGTFPALHGTPDQLRQAAPGIDVLDVEPGQTIEL